MPLVSLSPNYFAKLAVFFLISVGVELAPAAESVRIWQAMPARLDEVRGSQRRQLDRMKRFLSDEQLDEAFDIAAQILQSESPSVVEIADSRYVSLHEYCHRQLAELPQEQLERYRELVDPAAQVWFKRGIAVRDEKLLKRIVDQFFCSSWGDDALWGLGELALERGDCAAARRFWQSLSPRLVDSRGTLTYPDTHFELAAVRARLLLVSLRAEDWPRAEAELRELKATHPQARGQLGGREVDYAEHLEKLLQEAQGGFRPSPGIHWSTFAGGPTRTSAAVTPSSHFEQFSSLQLDREFETSPVSAHGYLIYLDPSGLRSVELATGKEVLVKTDEIFMAHSKGKLGNPFGSLTRAGSRVFGADQVLWGIDLKRDGALILRQASEEANVTFAGAPLVDDMKLYVALRENDRRVRAGIGCYDLSRRRWNWRHWTCQANTPATGWTEDLTATLLTMEGGIVYAVTNLGAVAAVDASDGRLLWIRTYDRVAAPLTAAGTCAYYRGPSPGILHRGRLLALPTDSKELLALDATTGALAWHRPLTSETALLAGASGGKLLLSDGGLQILDVRSGEQLAENRELPLQGRAVIAGTRILWPSAGKIHFLALATGKPQGAALPLPESGFADLAMAGEYLIATLPSQIIVFKISPSTDTKVSRLP